MLGDKHGRQGAGALREREERCSGTRRLLMLSPVAWTGKATGRRSVLTVHSGSSRGGKRRHGLGRWLEGDGSGRIPRWDLSVAAAEEEF